MELFIPVESLVSRGAGLSVFATLKAIPFVRKLAADWTEYRRSLEESGRKGEVGSVPQITLDGDNVAIQAMITDAETQKKFQVGALRGFTLSIDETYGQVTDILAADRAEDRSREVTLYKRNGGTTMPGRISPEIQKFLADRGFHPTTGRMLDNSGQPVDFAKKTYPTTGTSTDSGGDGSDEPGYQPELDLLNAFMREFKIAVTQLGEANENGDLSPEEVLEQASRIAMQRVINVTDLSNGPETQAQVREAQRQGQGDFNNMFNPNGFELKKRMDARADDGGLLAKLSREDRVSAGGLSASLLKSDGSSELRKFEDGSGDADCAKMIAEPDGLLKRLSARRDFRKSLDISVFNSAPRADEFRGSFSPGLDSLPLDAKIVNRPENLVAKLARRHARGGDELHKLLH